MGVEGGGADSYWLAAHSANLIRQTRLPGAHLHCWALAHIRGKAINRLSCLTTTHQHGWRQVCVQVRQILSAAWRHHCRCVICDMCIASGTRRPCSIHWQHLLCLFWPAVLVSCCPCAQRCVCCPARSLPYPPPVAAPTPLCVPCITQFAAMHSDNDLSPLPPPTVPAPPQPLLVLQVLYRTPLQLLRLPQLVWYLLRLQLADTPRQRRRLWSEQQLGRDVLPLHTLVLLLGLVFCVAWPLMVPVTLLYFVSSSVTQRYQWIYIYWHPMKVQACCGVQPGRYSGRTWLCAHLRMYCRRGHRLT